MIFDTDQPNKARKILSGKGSKKGIRKEGFLFVLVGKTNSGKSLLHSGLTNAKSLVADYFFTTKKPEVGMFDHFGVKAQVIDLPAVGCENFDYGILNTADCLIFVVEKLSDIDELEDYCKRSTKGRIVVINKADLYLSEEIRKMKERIKSKRINGILVSAATGIGIDELKNRMFGKMDVVRVYTKEPGKNKTKDPIVLKKGSKVRDVAEGIWKGFSKTVRETRLTGPSSKFPNQKVGMNHELRDMDVVEFHT